MPQASAKLAGCTKVFIVDTSVLLHDPDAISVLAKDSSNLVVVPLSVLEELGNKRSVPGEVGSNAMAVVRAIDGLRKGGKPSLHNGVQVEHGKGYVLVDYDGVGVRGISPDLGDTSENRILVIARNQAEQRKGAKVVIVTKNIAMRLKADALGLLTEDYQNDKVAGDSQLYSGVRKIEIVVDERDTITPLYSEQKLPAERLSRSVDLSSLYPNQCVVLSYGGKTVLTVYKTEGEERLFRHVPSLKPQNRDGRNAGIAPINIEQQFLYWLLHDQTIPCVMVTGKAGTGKSLISFLAGYHQLQREYERLLIFKPVIEVGQQTLGFLPGDLQEKMEPWKAAIFDSLRLVMNEETGLSLKEGGTARDIVEDFVRQGLMEIGPISFIRGRTFSRSFVVVDEVQNLTPREVKALITRVGTGSKIVLLGDTEQIDNPYLDGLSNGLVRAVHSLMGSELAAHIALVKGERSELAELAASIM